MRKLLILALPIFLIGCSTLPPVEIHEHKIQEQETVEVVNEVNNKTSVIEIPTPAQELPAIVAMPAPVPVMAPVSKEIIPENNEITIEGSTPVEYVKKKIKSVIIKKTVEALDSLDSTAPAAPEPEHAPTPPTNPMVAATSGDTRTGAKVQFFGIDLELWLGQNDSWSTIFKMITFMLVTYGGIRFINSLTGKRRRRLNIL